METQPTEDIITYCAVHTDREATLRCIRCDRYMCIQCTNQTPVGYVCDQCHHQQHKKFFTATPRDEMMIFGVSAVLTAIVGAILTAINLPVLFVLLLSFPIAGGISEATLRASGRRRGLRSHWVAAAGCLIGTYAGAALYLAIDYNNYVEQFRQMLNEYGYSLDTMPITIDQYITAQLGAQWGILLFAAIAAITLYSRYAPGGKKR